MADNDSDQGSVVRTSAAHLFDIETPKSEFGNDENSPLSPGEVRMMRNHPKVASTLFSPSRKSLGDSKIKPKSFSSSLLYASPSRKTVSFAVFCFCNFKSGRRFVQLRNS